MKRMTATMSLKQLRTDPRRLVQLLNAGYEIAITDHRQTLATARPPRPAAKPEPGDPAYILETIKNLSPRKTPIHPEMDTPALVKQLMGEALEAKQQRIQRQLDDYDRQHQDKQTGNFSQ